jgi:hypothetical protein
MELTTDLPADLTARLAEAADSQGISPAEYLTRLLESAFCLPDPLAWFDRLNAAAAQEAADAQSAPPGAPWREPVPAYLPLRTAGPDEGPPAPRSLDSASLLLHLLFCATLRAWAEDPAHPRTGEIAAVQTALAGRFFFLQSFAEFSGPLPVPPGEDAHD